MARAPKPEPKPTAWSLELLRRIEWKRFEELTAAFYRAIGLRSETIRCGADGGIDAKLFKGDSPDPTAIVQCKAWNARPVGVKPVRELLGVMTPAFAPFRQAKPRPGDLGALRVFAWNAADSMVVFRFVIRIGIQG
jgi:hypothetical protein